MKNISSLSRRISALHEAIVPQPIDCTEARERLKAKLQMMKEQMPSVELTEEETKQRLQEIKAIVAEKVKQKYNVRHVNDE